MPIGLFPALLMQLHGVVVSGMLRRVLYFAPWKLGFNQSRLNLCLLRDFLHTGLASTITVHTFRLPRFPIMLLSPLSFDLR